MDRGSGEQLPSYPIPSSTALGPPAERARLRQGCPVPKVALPSRDEAALLPPFEDVRQVLSDPRFTRLLNADDAAAVPRWEVAAAGGSGRGRAARAPGAVVTMAERATREDRADATREAILSTAERLFADRGVYAVSNRQVSEAAGQGNNAAVRYHFGTKADLVRAIARKHAVEVERVRMRLLAEIGDSTDVRDWVACLVRPVLEHLAELGSPTWYARFCAQVMADPALHEIMTEESLASPALRQTLEGFNRCRPELPIEVHVERGDMARHLILHMCAERERALAENTATPRASWHDAATGLIDGIVGLWLAPVSR